MDAYQKTSATMEENSLFFPDTSLLANAPDQSGAADHADDPTLTVDDQQENPAPLADDEEDPNLKARTQRRIDWKAFNASQDQESHRVQTSNFACFPTTAVSRARLADIINILDKVDNSRLTDQEALSDKKKNFRQLQDWILHVLARNVHQDDLDSTGVLPRIERFIDPSSDNLRRHKNRGIRSWFPEELTYLHRKWSKGDLLCDPNRGLIQNTVRDKNGVPYRTTYQLNKEYQHYVSASQQGDNGLVNGQRWYSREQMMRDGAHSATVAGISGTARDGAYSIVVGLQDRSHGYADIDKWYTIEYEGTTHSKAEGSTSKTSKKKAPKDDDDDDDDNESEEELTKVVKPTSATQRLLTSVQNGKSVRVIRTFKSLDSRTQKVYRYDGLYSVESARCTNANTQAYTFKLRRDPNQGELRGIRRYRGFVSLRGNQLFV